MVTSANADRDDRQVLPSVPYALPLRDVLSLRCLQGTQVLAGQEGLQRPVVGVNVMEVPDIIDWVKPHELLVTTGFPLLTHDGTPSDVPVTQLVRDLHARDVAGLGVKLGRYLHTVPEESLALADSLGFPVLGLPAGLGFDDLLRQAYTRLNELQAGVLERIDALHRALTELVLEGGDLDQIAAEVARVLDVGVLLTSSDGRERGGCLKEDLRARLEHAGLFEPTGRFRVERVTACPLPLAEGEVRTQPVVTSGSELGRLVCVSPERVFTADDVHALERAATVAALLLTRQQAVTAVENKYRADFLRDVFLERAGDRKYVVEHAAALGWDLDRPTLVVSAELDPGGPGDPSDGRLRRMWQERFAAAWRQVCEAHDRTAVTVDFSAEVVSLLPVPGWDRGSGDEAARAAHGVLSRILAAVRGDSGGGRRPFSAGVSRVAPSLDTLPEAYAQARRATEVGRRINGGGSTTHFDQLGVHRLLAFVPDNDELRAFARDVLGDLAEATPDAADLRSTLQALLDTNLNVAEAARLRFFHYNTMRYRVGKLEQMLGPFTKDPNLRLNIAVALQVQQIRG